MILKSLSVMNVCSSWKRAKLALCMLSTLVLAGCAPGLGSSLHIPDVKTQNISTASLYIDEARVGLFQDARPKEAVAFVNGRGVMPDTSPGILVQRALQHSLRAQGVRASQFRGPEITGQIKTWYVDVTPGFPISSATAETALNIEIRDENQSVRYRGTYRGVIEAKDAAYSEDEIAGLLADSLEHALKELFNDPGFVSALEGRQV